MAKAIALCALVKYSCVLDYFEHRYISNRQSCTHLPTNEELFHTHHERYREGCLDKAQASSVRYITRHDFSYT